ncbi:MAG: FtsW/RodA/SpoVE family cell cycle protein, partial [Candidatus Parcubacteria bacterium]|nr:FtsW/RodA/SpoVE family cell cycle protein [Candidatus Parcubacteria bacterium]
MRNAPDKIFLGTTIFLVFTGIFILASASMGLLTRNGPDFLNTLFRQILFGIIFGFVGLFIISRINYKKWKKYALPFFVFTFLLTLLVFVPRLGLEYGGAKRWLNLGPISFQ